MELKDAGDLIDKLGGNAAVSKHTGAHYQTVVAWRNRNRIPVDYWPQLQTLGSSKDLDLTAEQLVAMFARRAA